MSGPPLLSLRDVTIGFGGDPLFAGVELHLARGDRAALVGRNGSGKSTLMKIIAGVMEPDGGTLYREPGMRVAWLEQEPPLPAGTSVADYVAGAGHAPHAVDALLAEIGLDGARDAGTLSGGEARRAGLARVFTDPPDLLLLDEPTNHLDLATIEWLERRLGGFRGALLTISHDRAFLANVTNRVFWLDRGTLRSLDRGFAQFEDWRDEVLAEEQRQVEKLDTKLAAEAHWLIHGVTARRKRNQGRLARLAEMRAARASLIRNDRGIALQARQGDSRSRLMIEVEGISRSVPTAEGGRRVLFENFSTLVLRGDRLGIVGPNGAGKSTLIKTLVGEAPSETGRVKIAKEIAVAYFDQSRQQLDPTMTLRDVLAPQGGEQLFVQGRPRHIRAYLKDFLFDPRQADSPTGTLSGGERNRLLLAKILATPADLLVLDEPTNDLDTDTLDLLEEVLADFTGTLLVVSHDRDFLDKTVTSLVYLPGDGTITEYAGGFTDAMAQRRAAAGAERRQNAARAVQKAESQKAETSARPTRQPTRLSYKEQRELDGLPDRIAALEAEIAALERAMSEADFYTRDPSAAERAMARHAEAKAELGRLEERWLELEERRTALTESVAATDAGRP